VYSTLAKVAEAIVNISPEAGVKILGAAVGGGITIIGGAVINKLNLSVVRPPV
jgi:hypothetical protein